MKLNLKIWRQNNRLVSGHMVDYTVEGVSPDMSFLEMLDELNQDLIRREDEPIEFDNDCREGICGMCSLVINGVAHGPKTGTATCQLHMRSFSDGDSITIPPLQKVVYLFGDFNRPTILQFNSSYTLQDYIKLAGGTKDSATNDILLISPNGETSEIRNNFKIFGANKADIYPGSIIYVPRNIGQISGITYAATVAPVLSSLAISLASLNSISD